MNPYFAFVTTCIYASVVPIIRMSNVSVMMINLIDARTVFLEVDVYEAITTGRTISSVSARHAILVDGVNSTRNPLPSLSINFSTLT